jgi:tetratricopeptide (TPR) repeat protein
VHQDRRALEGVQEQGIERKYEEVRQQNPHEILGVSPSATHEEIEAAYEQTKAQYGRDRLLPRVRQKFRSQIALIESRLIEAFLTLSQPGRGVMAAVKRPEKSADLTAQGFAVRVELDRPKAMLEADKANQVADAYFAKGRRCLREGDFHNAIQYGKLAISHNSSDARYFSLLADCQVRNPEGRWQRMAEENYTRATQLDPWNSEYWVNLGRLYKRRGMTLRARKNFEEALRLVPGKPEVLNELANLD